MQLGVTHVVATKSFAGVERYITYVALHLAMAGVRVTVIGGDPSSMTAALRGTDVRWRPRSEGAGALAAARRGEAEILHPHMTHAELACALATIGSRVPIVATRHFAQPRGRTAAGRLVGRRVGRHIDRQVAISQFVADNIDGPSVVIPNAVPRADEGAHSDRVVLVAQRLEVEKDTETALRAWRVSRLGEDGWRMVVAGRGARRADLERLSRQLGIEGSVEFRGFVNDLPALMADAALLFATAPAEPFGLAVVEAMACGLPVLAAAGGGHLETVGAVAPQSLFPVEDAGAAGQALRVLATDEERRRAEGQALRAHQQIQLGIERHIDRLLAVYEEVLGRPARSATERGGD
jgi:glycosyltransferase involved in cell wall biosynthesis